MKQGIHFNKIAVGLGWANGKGAQPDLDASVFMVGADGKLPDSEYFVYYNNLVSFDGAVVHHGDSQTQGILHGDEREQIDIDLDRVDPQVKALVFVVTIHKAEQFGHNFGRVEGAYLRVLDRVSRAEIVRYELSDDFSVETGVTVGKFVREGKEWVFEAVGIGEKGGLAGYLERYR